MLKQLLKKLKVHVLRDKLRIRYGKYIREHSGFRTDIKIKWFGNRWSGFFIDTRLININSVVFSFGVGADISFDMNLFQKGVGHIYLFDPTPAAINYIQTIQLPRSFSFYPFGLSDHHAIVPFYLPVNKSRVSGSSLKLSHLDKQETVQVEMKKLSECMEMLQLDHIDILKMDIEGSEFAVIRNMMDEHIYPAQICVEFHARFFDDGNQKVADTIKLLEQHHYQVSAHTDGEEYLFCRKE